MELLKKEKPLTPEEIENDKTISKSDFKEVAEASISEKSSVFNTLKFAKEEMEAEKDTEEK